MISTFSENDYRLIDVWNKLFQITHWSWLGFPCVFGKSFKNFHRPWKFFEGRVETLTIKILKIFLIARGDPNYKKIKKIYLGRVETLTMVLRNAEFGQNFKMTMVSLNIISVCHSIFGCNKSQRWRPFESSNWSCNNNPTRCSRNTAWHVSYGWSKFLFPI